MSNDRVKSQYIQTLMKYGLKQKPLAHYFENGVVKFSIKDGKLFFTVKQITKEFSGTLFTKEVNSKSHLDKILGIKNLHEIPSIEKVE